MKKIILCAFILVGTFSLPAQNQNTKWYFGGYAALDFMTNPPTILNNSNMSAHSGCSSIADADGNLLFYTDGEALYNNQHSIIGTLEGDDVAIQSSIIIKKPCSTNLYYIFTMASIQSTTGLHYAVADISLAGGTGSLVAPSVSLSSSPYVRDELHATKHANGTDYWIMTHEAGTNNFIAYLLTSSGINTTAVVSSVGTPVNGFLAGYIKFSPTGQKIGRCEMSGNYTGIIEVYDFDNNTGVVSNPLTLATGNNVFYYTSCEFSPDGTKFYSNIQSVYQWNLSAGSTAAVLSSSVNLGGGGFGMQLAPNGKIYLGVAASQTVLYQSIHVINNPDVAGSGCNFVPLGQAISAVVSPPSAVNPPLNSYYTNGLPNLITSPCISSFNLSNANVNTCYNSATGSVSAINITGCPSYLWSNGITTYTTQQVSTLSVGTWSIKVIGDLGCSTQSVFTVTELPPTTINPSITSNNVSICLGNSVTLNASGANSYLWSNGANTPSTAVSPTLTTQYYVTGIDQNGCTVNSAPVTVSVEPLPTLNISASNSFTLCTAQMQTLTVSGAYGYMWKWGTTSWATAPNLVVNPAVTTQYTVTGSSQQGCKSVEVVTVTIGCVGVEDLGVMNDELRVYPNPVDEVLNVDISASLNVTEMKNGGKIEIYVYDILGKVILNKQLAISSGSAQINVSQIPKGIYFIKIETDNYPSVQRKFVKE